jgi:hypothetical protein
MLVHTINPAYMLYTTDSQVVFPTEIFSPGAQDKDFNHLKQQKEISLLFEESEVTIFRRSQI